MSKSTTKKIPCCSYCEKPGHRINKCTDPAIQELLQEAEEASTISFVFGRMWNPKLTIDTRECVQTWLKELNPCELKVLAYHFKVPQDKRTCLDFLPYQFYKEWIDPYDTVTIYSKMVVYSDETLEIWQDFLCKNFRLSQHNVSYRIRDLCYPSRKFFIDTNQCDPSNPTESDCPICFANLTPENAVKTGCNHEYCNQCLFQYMRSESKNKSALSCPLCRDSIKTLHASKETHKILTTRFCKKPEQAPAQVEAQRGILVSEVIRAHQAAYQPQPQPRLQPQQRQQSHPYSLLEGAFRLVFWFIVASVTTSALKTIITGCGQCRHS